MPFRHQGPILAIEDGDEDFDFLQHILRECGANNPLLRISGGDEALAYIQSGGAGGLPRPEIVLLDLNLPGADGRELLRELRASQAFAATPVVVLSTSNNPRDVRLCYALGASCYLIKPVGLDQLERTLAGFAAFWLDITELPKGV